tara:strand:+ start:50 stop:1207 length:1158 start_codon:yes stop_codon:yes gene_type:complete
MNFNLLVASRPFLSLKHILLKNKFKNNKNNALFFSLGRDALLYALKKNGLEKGSTIIIPAYMCKSTLEPIIDFGIKIIFQDIDDNLNLDLVLLKENITKHNAKAVLVINYFGFKSNIKDVGKLCSSLKITSIEDCSHSYMSYNHFYKSIEDSNFAIYSIRKSLPVYDGGVLRINDNDLNKSFFENADPKTVSLKSQVQLIYMHLKHIVVRYFEFFIIKIRIFNLYSEFITKIKNFVRRDGHETKLYESNDPSHPSILLKSYINNTESEYDIKETIIKNYSEIMSKISELGYKPLYSKLPDKCIPQYAIFYDDSEKLYNFLRNNKIGASRWPDYEMPDQVKNNDSLFPMANFYNKKLIMLPIHQCIKKRHIKRILDIMTLCHEIKI